MSELSEILGAFEGLPELETRELRLPCGFRFPGGGQCLVFADHAIHRGEWTRPEPNHDYEPFERRKAERRIR